MSKEDLEKLATLQNKYELAKAESNNAFKKISDYKDKMQKKWMKEEFKRLKPWKKGALLTGIKQEYYNCDYMHILDEVFVERNQLVICYKTIRWSDSIMQITEHHQMFKSLEETSKIKELNLHDGTLIIKKYKKDNSEKTKKVLSMLNLK